MLKKSNKISLEEATRLAILGRLPLKESTTVTTTDDNLTVVETDDANIVIEPKDDATVDINNPVDQPCTEPECADIPVDAEVPEDTEIPADIETPEDTETSEDVNDGTELTESKEAPLFKKKINKTDIKKVEGKHHKIAFKASNKLQEGVYTVEYISSFYELYDSSWGQAKQILDEIKEAGKEEELMDYLEEFGYDEQNAIDRTELNDMLAYDWEPIFEALGINENDEDEDEDEDLDESKKVTEEKDTPELVQKAKDWKKRVAASKDEDTLQEIVEEIMDEVKDLSETNWAAEDLYNGAEGVMDDQDAADRGPATYIRSVKMNFKNILTDFINNYADACADAELDESKKIKTEGINEDLDASEMLRKILEYYQDNAMSDSFFEDLANIADYDKIVEWFKSIELDEGKKVESKEATLFKKKINKTDIKKVEGKEPKRHIINKVDLKKEESKDVSKDLEDKLKAKVAEGLTKFVKESYKNGKEVKVEKVLKLTENKLYVKGKLVMENSTRDFSCKLIPVNENKTFRKYTIKENKLLKITEGKTSKGKEFNLIVKK